MSDLGAAGLAPWSVASQPLRHLAAMLPRSARPIAATLQMEMMEEVRASPCECDAENAATCASVKQRSDDLSPAAQRRSTVAAVRVHGGHASGIRLSDRERCRRLVTSLPWLGGQLLACITDVSMLFAEVAGASLALVNTVTALVLFVFVLDLALRTYTYRRMLLRSLPAHVDFLVIGVSLILYIVGLVAEAQAQVTSSRGVSASMRSLIVVLRLLRAARALAMLAKAGGAGSAAARQATGENKRRYVDVVCAIAPRTRCAACAAARGFSARAQR